MSLQDVKTLLCIHDNSRDDLLTLIITNAEKQLLSRLVVNDEPLLVVPPELDYIVTELAVMRYNRIGAEGAKSESVEGKSVTYNDNDFLPFESTIADYLNRFNVPKKGVVRFI